MNAAILGPIFRPAHPPCDKAAARPGGLNERIFLGLELAWLATAACRIARLAEPDVPERGP
jgi:hypothetical protein